MFTVGAAPGLARADRGRPARVDALTGGLRVPDEAATAALHEALAMLPASGRLRLLESLRADADAAGVDPGPWLSEALAQETHPSVLRAMLDRLDSTPPGTRAWSDARAERFLFARPWGEGGYVWLEIQPRAGGLELSSGRCLQDALCARALGLEPTHPRRQATLVAPLLFRHRRAGGRLPDAAKAFAKLF